MMALVAIYGGWLAVMGLIQLSIICQPERFDHPAWVVARAYYGRPHWTDIYRDEWWSR